ncbi:hypothetical protein DRP53_04090 [candidate division WOR-3 bacterium]|uniref:Permease n=1 Tax=candidate division WOR-3 bacterium TaxID=2052148 RepID=A0A660SL66_UNCW3|nr:MAG: hypothetical protein DRP53_04090 [candidate division WOR-3 bacterium]
MKKDLILLGILLTVAIVMLSIFPARREVVITTSWRFFYEMIMILPAVMVLVGLFNVFVPRTIVVQYLGQSAGIKVVFLGILIGALPTGPLYMAFPVASALLRKGAKVSGVIAFLSAWGCIKVPQEMVELQFLGPRFMVARLILTIIFVIIMGLVVERLVGGKDG